MKIPVQKVIVLWYRGGRIGSIHRADMSTIRKQARVALIQVDVSGCEHWEVSPK